MHIYTQIWGSSGECSPCIYLDVDFTSQVGYRISGCKALWSTHTEIILGEYVHVCKLQIKI